MTRCVSSSEKEVAVMNRIESRSRRTLLRIATLASFVAWCGGSAQAQTAWRPERTVELIVYSAAGGGNDKSARMLDKIWKELKLADAVVVNKVGGGGNIAYTYISQKPGDAHFIGIAQTALVTNQITGRSSIHYKDFTPLAFIGSEPAALAVRADSPYRNVEDLLAQLRKDPQSISFSVGSTLGAANHISLGLLAKAAGVDAKRLKVVVFSGGALSMSNLLGGHIDAVMMAANNSIPHHAAGTVRILGMPTPERSPALPDVPTFRETGYDVTLEGWTIVVGPKGLSSAQTGFWEAVLQKSVNHDHWKKYVAQNSWRWGYKNSRDTAAYLDQYYDQSRHVLTEIGMAK
jgi:putative tricarboxylic transport membrane protein